MKKLLIIFILFLLTTPIFSQDIILVKEYFDAGIDFIGLGTEPFWDVKIDFEKGIYFSSQSYNEKIETGIPELVPSLDMMGLVYVGKNTDYNIRIWFMKEACSNKLSGDTYKYSVKVYIYNLTTEETKELSGCGYYTFDYNLNDIWALEKLNGVKFEKSKYYSQPYIEFHIKEEKFMTNTGCNEYRGGIEIQSDKIIFDNKITSTNKICSDMTLEEEFINTLRGKKFVYKIEPGKLYLIENGITVVEYKKID